MGGLLRPDEGDPVIVVNENGQSPVVLVCEHAGKVIPQALGDLGLSPEDLTRHIAWDIGAEVVSRRLSEALDAPLLLQRYSRLAYDCNRPPESPDAMPVKSETTRVPGNENLSPDARLARIRGIYRPFHHAVSELLDRRAARNIASLVVTMHSFTPIYRGIRRHLDLGVLHDRDTRLADLVLGLCGRMKDVVVRRNEPYGPQDGVCHTLNLHGGARGLHHVMLEIRNDLINHEAGQVQWAGRLAQVLEQAVSLVFPSISVRTQLSS
ncbi:N-formylglutamate amidohydrolase [Aestuariivirga sp. YIM B02566]|uniref:N-formylglutamate amidohydrolase n=1 Tax=Taklimakanibacter albus TaxID=2800327 RepID=A0ACC5R631_9HYPH|nr:N-formylglutamate amidohydrolase [Aestuariivirga sp. YIM B02566]MBK1868037.1 N-formylglutamate amidohydrolase [Aestuariivirga sp. YIM B02566]